jgi:hypothetical protein
LVSEAEALRAAKYEALRRRRRKKWKPLPDATNCGDRPDWKSLATQNHRRAIRQNMLEHSQ